MSPLQSLYKLCSFLHKFRICYHLISRTVGLMLVANSSSRALRLGSLCKPTHKRRLWELCLSGALQILDLIDWLIDNHHHHCCRCWCCCYFRILFKRTTYCGVKTEDWPTQTDLAQNGGDRPTTNEPWPGVSQTICTGQSGMATTRDNGYAYDKSWKTRDNFSRVIPG